jgi:hypothetical protein
MGRQLRFILDDLGLPADWAGCYRVDEQAKNNHPQEGFNFKLRGCIIPSISTPDVGNSVGSNVFDQLKWVR